MNFITFYFLLSLLEAASAKFGYATAPNVSYCGLLREGSGSTAVPREFPELENYMT